MEFELLIKAVGAKIKATREKKNISQRELGELCEVNYSRICKIELGEEDCDILTIYHIADALGVHPKDFF